MFITRIIRTNKPKIYKMAEMIFLLFLGLYLAFLSKVVTNYTFSVSAGAEKFLLVSLRISVIIKMILFFWNKFDELKRNRILLIKTIALILFAEGLRIIYYTVYHTDKYTFLLFMAVLVVGTIGTDYRMIMKTYTIAVGLIIGSAVLASLSGYISNYVSVRNGHVHSSWGTVWTTDYGSIILYLCMISWMAWNKLNARVFVFLGGVAVLNAAFIAGSITSTVTGVCFVVSVIIADLSLKNSRRLTSILLEGAFPFFALLTFGMGYLYHKGTSIGIKADQFFHGRLRLMEEGIRNYGLKLFGTPFDQIGGGRTTIVRSDYNFIDSTYVLVLLRYGIVLFILTMVLWVLMTRKAIIRGHKRLAFGMALIALHSFSEHHFPEVNFNILIILPFSILGMGWLVKEDEPKVVSQSKEKSVAGLVTTGIMIFGTLFVGPRLLSLVRTLFDVSKDTRLKNKEIFVCITFMAMIVFLIVGIIALYNLVYLLLCKLKETEISIKNRIIIPSVVLFVLVCILIGGIFKGNRIINRKSVDYTECIDIEEDAIKAVKRGIKASNGKFYADDIPSIYRDRFGNVSYSFYQGDEFADGINTTVLMDADYESATMLNMGFLYTEISGEHALYTNDIKVINELEAIGYHLTGFYSRECYVDLEEEAERNGLEYTASGSIMLSGRSGSLIYGPYYELRGANYTVSFDMSLPKVDDYVEDYKICTLRVSTIWGTGEVKDVPVFRRDFDEEGNLVRNLKMSIVDSRGCEFLVFVEESCSLLLNGISFKKTPDVDIHRTVDKKGRTISMAYYDIEGNAILMSDGYHAVEYKYDKNNNISCYWCYGVDGKLIIIKAGYAGIEKEYDVRKRVSRESYFGQDRERLTMENGQSAVAYGYDENGNINEYKYYDVDNNLVMTANGYAILRRSFDKNKKIVYEAYFDTEDKPVTIDGGFASVRYSYNEDGREYDRKFFDEEGNLVVTTAGFAERHMTYDAKGNILIEEYYGVDGERIVFGTGQSIVEYEYDMYGNKANIYYYGVDEKPVMYNGTYHHLSREYNNKGQVVRESWFDTEDKPIVRAEGYVINEREYDEYGNISVNRYLDADGKPVMRTDGFFEVINTYNDKKQNIKSEYYDISGTRVILPVGYSIVEAKFDENGNQADLLFYDKTGAPAMNRGLYFRLHRTFNDLNQNIREDYLDASGKPMMRLDNFAATERDYDSNGNKIEERYLDTAGKLSLNTSGYAIIRMEYDENGNLSEQRFLGTARQLVDCISGYATIEYTYDDAGNLVNTVYYNAKGEVVE